MARERNQLTPRQAAFVKEYLVHLNATKAAVDAGYSAKTAESQGSRLLKYPKIQAAVEAGQAERGKRLDVSADRVLREVARIAFVDIGLALAKDGSLLPVDEIPEDVRRAIAGVELEELFDGRGETRTHVGMLRKVKLSDKLRALELIAQLQGYLRKRVELSGPDGGPIPLAGLSDAEFRELASNATAPDVGEDGGGTAGPAAGGTPAGD